MSEQTLSNTKKIIVQKCMENLACQLVINKIIFSPLIFIKKFSFFPDAISENQPRVIDDSRARKLANDLKRCAYYETCATYGLNVERVFQDGK